MLPVACLTDLSQKFPNAWKLINRFRECINEEPQWPNWCFLPMDAWYSIVSHEHNSSILTQTQMRDAATLAAIGTWRYTQGIYSFNRILYADLFDYVPIKNLVFNPPFPEWSSYIVTPLLKWNNAPIYGFWCHLEWNAKTNLNELRIVINTHKLITLSFHLTNWALQDINILKPWATLKEPETHAPLSCIAINTNISSLYQIVRLIHYFCSDKVTIYNEFGKKPKNPVPRIYKGNRHLFPVQGPTYWKIIAKI